MTKPMEITDAEFQATVLESELPVLVDFWADWCQPCKMIAPIVEELAGEYEGKLSFAKMDVDSNPMTPSKYGIRGIPALLFFHGGEAVEQVVGAVPKSVLKQKIDSVLSGA